MAKLSELNLKKDVIKHEVAALTELPAQMGMRPPMLQPGSYIFQLPPTNALREAFDADDEGNLVVLFRDDAALTVVQAPPESEGNVGRPFGTRLSTKARKRGKADDPNAKAVSDVDYLLASLGETAMPKTMAAYGDVVAKHGGGRFGADVELNWSCNPKRNIRVEVDGGQLVEADGTNGIAEQKGCGARYYQRDVEQVDGKFPSRVNCNCGAVLFANENLTRFRKVSQQTVAKADAAKG